MTNLLSELIRHDISYFGADNLINKYKLTQQIYVYDFENLNMLTSIELKHLKGNIDCINFCLGQKSVNRFTDISNFKYTRHNNVDKKNIDEFIF